MKDDLRRMALFGSGVAELTRHRAEQLARDLVERSKQNREDLMNAIRKEISNQLATLGVATKRDVERLERRVARLESNAGPRKTKSASSGKKSTTTKKKAATPRTDGSGS